MNGGEEFAQLLLEGKKGEALLGTWITPGLCTTNTSSRIGIGGVPSPNDHYPAFSGITLPSVPFLPTSRAFAPHPVSLQQDHSPLPEVDTSPSNPSFQLESPQQESPFNESFPQLTSSLRRPSPHVTLGPMDPLPDAMDWLTPASDVDVVYSEAPTPYEYEGHLRSRGMTFLSSPSRARGARMNVNTNNPPNNLLFLCCTSLNTQPTATAFSDMWKDVGGAVYGGLSVVDGYAADVAFDTLFEPLGFDAGYGVEGAVGAVGYEYAEGMGMVV
ncbi:uncharacterized protein LACBIDRAFT_327962 [Laccaria bicolor S238N-H82]|uniref:Predicted protein n=1 Tax=Laccaria bicolor (strain S238N-H82 / ATCC MYA-4686) TaxID=486041 RepID=B0DDD4_LACBS|nr:uncharacterized protein LACBIDRAFT_327962 [Laccaria bicolor S238N-H82]EDR07591.1 predicted protein [Laccaria bicolor S238N-H82]|eukprot:XP_001881983.1 predicted protein [Laccaria bicolor S238N-H82]